MQDSSAGSILPQGGQQGWGVGTPCTRSHREPGPAICQTPGVLLHLCTAPHPSTLHAHPQDGDVLTPKVD